MSLLVDSCAWSEAFRKNGSPAVKRALADVLLKQGGTLIGAVRQEVLSGLKDEKYFVYLKAVLREFLDLKVNVEDHENAASLCNTCRSAGVQGSPTDFLICAVAIRMNVEIFTYDNDFERFAKFIPIRLYKIGHG